ncbi:MAG TPA: oxidoreductase [Symbiobacteriaceae bacterium]|nr:oxidoreductase [Symbiobacteriaceae bacterium]
MKERTALVAGSTGLVGGELVKCLLDSPAYRQVTVLVRRPLDLHHPRLVQQTVDFDHLSQYAAAFQVNDLYSCLGTTRRKTPNQEAYRRVDLEYPLAMARLGKEQGAVRFMLVSSMGADAGSAIFYNRLKGEAEQALEAVGLPALHIFRPSLLLGDRQEFRFGERIAVALSPLYAPLMVGGLRKLRPIHARTVARAMIKAALEGENGQHVYESDLIAAMGE